MLFENISLAISGLLANKMRALLTMLGIIIGIGSVITIMTVGDSLKNNVSSSMQSMGASNITVYVENKEAEEETGKSGLKYKAITFDKSTSEDDMISDEMIEAFKQEFADRIDGVSLSGSLGSGQAVRGNNYANVSINGINQDYFISNKITMIAGRKLSNKDYSGARQVTMVSDKFVENLYQGNNKDALGQEVEVKVGDNYYTYTIVGIYKYEQNPMMMSMGSGKNVQTNMYTPIKTVQKQLHVKGGYGSVDVIAASGIDSTKLMGSVKQFFSAYYRNNRYFKISTFSMESMMAEMMNMMNTMNIAIAVIAGISLLVGGIGVMNIMLVSITERTREIGTRKALGAPNSSIRTQFIVEAMVICLIGGAIGVTLGIILGITAASALGFPAEPSIMSIVVSLLFSMSIGVFFGYYPANKAAKMDPIEALRYE